MSNPGDRWRRGWLLLAIVLGLVAALILGRCAADSGSTKSTSGTADREVTAEKIVAPFNIDASGDPIVLSGGVGSEAEHQSILAKVSAAFPGRAIDDQIRVVEGRDPVVDIDAIIESVLLQTAVDTAGPAPVDTTPSEPASTEPASTEPASTEIAVAPSTEPATQPTPETAAPVETTIASEPTTTIAAEVAAAVESINQTIALDGIQFRTSSATLTSPAKTTLDNVAATLSANPTVKVEVGGHTDNIGDAGINQTLSQARAEAVVAYLTAAGVDASRMTAVGYGDTRPVADNATADGRAKNRRIEFTPQA